MEIYWNAMNQFQNGRVDKSVEEVREMWAWAQFWKKKSYYLIYPGSDL